ncbi:site-specific integrase [Alsobacter sp. SYSU M60028]|uniref:Site-specific integrase n=1 Tax=Alsobacter ponti TaxID=2962936 RepID=A0ABT1L7B4_9HYPH|nr:site-specific integrase [Alsobacter ponti]MCP8937345.1 site-specific integrase [Alsobacter ponti]
MSTPSPSRATLQTVLDALAAADLPSRRRQDMASAVRTVAKVLGRAPAELAADPPALRRRLETVAPAANGMCPQRWKNVRSLLNAALAQVRPMLPGRSVEPIGPEWLTLLEHVPEDRRIRLQPLLRVLTRDNIAPADVTLVHLEAYRDSLRADSLRRDPEGAWRALVWHWNFCAREVAGWPQLQVELPQRRETYTRPWSDFPASLKAEVDAWLRRMSGDTFEDDGPPRPARPETLIQREYQLRAFASILVEQGRPAASLERLANLVSFDAYKLGLSFLLDRKRAREARQAAEDGDQAPTSLASSQIWGMATFLTSVARHWVKADAETLKAMSRISAKFAPTTRGMTPKNRERMRQFDDDRSVSIFLEAPWRMKADADSGKLNPHRSAIRAQIAVAIAMLQYCPVRKKNLTEIDLERHFKRLGDKVYLLYRGHRVKNGEALDFELPQDLVDLLDWYLAKHRPALLDGPSNALFPGKGGKAKSKHTLGLQIGEVLFEYTGLKLSPHGFRHAAGKLFLDIMPGSHVIMQQVLGHSSLKTTLDNYTGEEKKRASRLFQETVIARRERLMASRGGKPGQSPRGAGVAGRRTRTGTKS